MPDRTLGRLVRFELSRIGPFLARGTVLTAVAALLVGLVRGWDSELLWMLLLGSGLSHAVQVPAQLARDRLGGELLALTALPVTAGAVVAGKLGAAVVVSALGAAHGAVAALLLASPGTTASGPLALAAGAFVWGWLGLFAGSAVSTALLARFDPRTLATGPVPVAVLLLVGASWLVERWTVDPLSRLGALPGRPWFLVVALAVGVLGTALVALLSCRTAGAAIRAERDVRHTARG